MKTLAEILHLSSTFLQDKGVERPKRSAEELIASMLGMQRIDLFLQSFDRPMGEEELAKIREGLLRHVRGEPIEYIAGEVDFYGCKIRVDRRVLIPRPETEILVDLIAKRVEKGVFWDLCTGSGCIGIALKKARPQLEMTLSDLSPDALALARDNALKNGVEGIAFYQGDLFTPFAGQRADFIACNPPYIGSGEYEGLDPSVRDFEPKMALVGGKEGVEVYERLALELPSFLNPGGRVFLEIGSGQGERVQKIFEEGPWAKKELIKDWAGKDRFFFLEKQ